MDHNLKTKIVTLFTFNKTIIVILMMSVSVSSFAENIYNLNDSRAVKNVLYPDPSNELKLLFRKNNIFSPKTSEDLNFLIKYTSEKKIKLSPIEAVVGSSIYTEDQVLELLRDRNPNLKFDKLKNLRDIAISKVTEIVNSDEYLVSWLTYKTLSKAKLVGAYIKTNTIPLSQKLLKQQVDQHAIESTKMENLKNFERKYLPTPAVNAGTVSDEGQAM